MTVSSEDRRASTPEALQALETDLREALAPRLQLLRLLGQGGMGSVFLARDPALRRLVVVKVLSPSVAHDPIARARFAREAETAASVAHPNVVHVYQVGTLERSGTTYFTMQFVDGPTLEQAYPIGTPVPESVAKRIVGEIASALAAAHARGLVHRDIKPANVMIDRESGRAVVLDFGISAARLPEGVPQGDRATIAGMVVGTPAYMSPEQAGGETAIDRSDIYSLGIVAYELVTGAVPFSAKTPMALVAAHLRDVPPAIGTVRPDLDPRFAALIDQCLSKAPAQRPSAESIARYLAPQSQGQIEWPPPGLETLRGQGSRHLGLLATGSVLCIAFLLLLAGEPNAVTGGWNRHDTGLLWVLAGNDGRGGFHFLLLVLVVGTAALLFVLVANSWVTARALGRARRSGYPWTVVLDVAFDHFPFTADLLNRQGPFALLDASRAALFWRRRRWRIVCRWLAVVAGYSLLLAWWVGWLTPVGGDPLAVVSEGGVWVIILLPLIPLLVATLLGLDERIIRRGARRRASRLGPPPLPRRELVTAWLAGAAIGTPGRHLFPTFAVLTSTVAGIVAVVLALVFFGWTNVSYIFSWSFQGNTSEQSATEFLNAIRNRRDVVSWWPRVDSVLLTTRPNGQLPTDSGVAAIRVILALGVRQRSPATDTVPTPSFWKIDPAPPRSEVAGPSAGPRGRIDPAAWDFGPGGLTPEQHLDLEARAGSRWAALGKTVARSRPLPRAWALDLADTTLHSLRAVGNPYTQVSVVHALESPLGAFEAAAILATLRGDRAQAMAAVDLASGYTLTLLREPTPLISGIGISGIVVVQRMATHVGATFADPRMTRIAQTLAQALAERRAVTSVYGLQGRKLMADPETPAGFPALADRRIFPPIRIELLEGIVSGACENPREVIFGISPLRRTMIERSAGLMRDLPEIDEMQALELRRYDRMRALSRAARHDLCLSHE